MFVHFLIGFSSFNKCICVQWKCIQLTRPSNQFVLVGSCHKKVIEGFCGVKNGLYTVRVSCKEKKIIFTFSFVAAAAAPNWSRCETKQNIKINQKQWLPVCARGMWIERQVQCFWGGLFWVNRRKEGWRDRWRTEAKALMVVGLMLCH